MNIQLQGHIVGVKKFNGQIERQELRLLPPDCRHTLRQLPRQRIGQLYY
ncbi:hypothetical protein NM2007056_1084 [Neisseria meningitidis 2007056]|nr:hypothetical protein NM2007056_1084 [Neisseria meningitidis 2007056]